MRALKEEFCRGFKELAPGRFPYRRFLGALAIGAAGGMLFLYLRLPLPWMLGSMLACTVAALLRAPIAAPTVVTPPMTMIVGVMLGAGFSPQILDHLAAWIAPILGLAVSVVLCGAACVAYFRRFAGFDLQTAYFCGMPGGLVEMVVLGSQWGGDARTIALVHSARILLVVFTLPFIVQFVGGVTIGTASPGAVSILTMPWQTGLLVLTTGLIGIVVAHFLRLRAKYLLGPMLVSAAAHVSGLMSFAAPIELLNGAQLVLGTAIGCRFIGTPPREILRIVGFSLGSTVILVSITLTLAFAVSRLSSYGIVPLILAYSPGGLTEMSLVALSLQMEVAFVAAHHIVRVAFVTVGAGIVFALVSRDRGEEKGTTQVSRRAVSETQTLKH